MENNSLYEALHGPERSQLHIDWPTRKNICIEVARGLLYLHESTLTVVHRDVKPSNVLLDKDLVPKLADFDTTKLYTEEPPGTKQVVAGTYGYIAPEYWDEGKLSLKVDVYNFGVLTLEVVSGKENVKYQPTENLLDLVEWAVFVQCRGDLLDLVDSRLGSSYDRNEATMMLRLAMMCISQSPDLRPTMSQTLSIIKGESTLEAFETDPTVYQNELREIEMRQQMRSIDSEEVGQVAIPRALLLAIQEVKETSTSEIQEVED